MLRYCSLYYTVSDSSTLCFPWKSIVSDAFHLLSTCARTIENVHRCQRKHCPGWKNLKTEPYRLRWTAETEPLRKIMPFTLYAHAQMMFVVLCGYMFLGVLVRKEKMLPKRLTKQYWRRDSFIPSFRKHKVLKKQEHSVLLSSALSHYALWSVWKTRKQNKY